jgi:hypothetical protein
MTSERDLFDNIWTDVTITKLILDRGKVITQEVNVKKDDIEEEHREDIRSSAPDGENDEVAADFSMPNTMFQAAIMRSVKAMFEMPVSVEGQHNNEIRFLPPTAIKEVVVTVNNLGQVIIA